MPPSEPKRPAPTDSRPLRILIAEDHSLMAAALRRVLSERGDVEIVGEAAAGDDVVPLVLETRPDVVLLDIGLPRVDGIQCAERIRELRLDVRILMLTAYGDSDSVTAAQRAGADGYILKSAGVAELVEHLRSGPPERFLLAGFPSVDPEGVELTAREREVLQAMCDGRGTREIGQEFWITEPTVKFHLKNLFRKLGASSRAEAIQRARQRGLVWSGERRPSASS
jgi:DNA-binding NarL/FixJ family response regulator